MAPYLAFAAPLHARPPSLRRPRAPARCCLNPPHSLSPLQVSHIESSFRALGADAAADLAYVALSPSTTPPSPNWPAILALLSTHGIKGSVLSRVARRLSIPTLLHLHPPTVTAVLTFLQDDLNLAPQHLARVISQRPDLLLSSANLPRLLAALSAAALTPKDIAQVVSRWPGLLLVDAARIARIARFLASPLVALAPPHRRALLRRAPWVLVYDVDTEMAPAAAFLRDTLAVPDGYSLQRFVLASPLLLGTSRAAMEGVVRFLREDVGLDRNMLRAAVRGFPPLLTCSVVDTLQPAVAFLKEELGFDSDDLARVVRAFPTVVTLDVECNMLVVVNFFRQRGVVNVGRIVKRLPPILGYDLQTQIIPKMEYVVEELGLSNFDILNFPGYFSYSMEKCIEPRTKFLQAKGLSVGRWGLNMVLALTDQDFCARVAHSPPEQYYNFRKAYRHQKKTEQRTANISISQNSFEPSVCNSSTSAEMTSVDWENPLQYRTRRKRRFRATLTRMPWNELR